MKALRIVSDNKFFNNFYCRNCKCGTNTIYRVEGKTFCDKCIDKNIKEEDICTINQNKEVI